MARHKYEAPRKRISPMVWGILVVVILGTISIGVAAYLSASSGPVANKFSAAEYPIAAVDAGNSITVTAPGYAVYVRAAVVVNWVDEDGNILSEMPEASLTLRDNWFQHTDGFYYYQGAVTGNASIPFYSEVTVNGERTGYSPKVDVAVQTIQALGTTDVTDTDPVEISAVLDAWGIPIQTIDPTTQWTDPTN